MAFVNISKPTTSLANVTKVSFGETWGNILTTWATETRTWIATGSLMSNTARGDYLWGVNSFPWLEALPWANAFSGLTNISKPV